MHVNFSLQTKTILRPLFVSDWLRCYYLPNIGILIRFHIPERWSNLYLSTHFRRNDDTAVVFLWILSLLFLPFLFIVVLVFSLSFFFCISYVKKNNFGPITIKEVECVVAWITGLELWNGITKCWRRPSIACVHSYILCGFLARFPASF